MNETVIRVEKLGKRYRIGEREPYLAMREVLANSLSVPWRVFRPRQLDSTNHRARHIWALKEVSFDVREGEVVGIIGRNGAGKTTLLKILARVTRPTEGFAEVRGRMGSLLEVGTGFHPELTGRENVYLSGAILGMRKREIKRKFDEIVAFADVEKFIDTPLKHYSSGMQMRLAFAVAAHLEPEILLVDEVLAVGDAAFQRKCMGKMGDVAKEGRTILFVSHNMAAVQHLCPRSIWLSNGGIHLEGPSVDVVDRYLHEVFSLEVGTPLADRRDRIGDGRIRFTGLSWENAQGELVSTLRSGGDYKAVLTYECPDGKDKKGVLVSFGLLDHTETFVLLHQTNFSNQTFELIPPCGRFTCHIPRLPLAAGEYSINLYVGTEHDPFDSIEHAGEVQVEGGNFFGTGHPGRPELCKHLTECDWELQPLDVAERKSVSDRGS